MEHIHEGCLSVTYHQVAIEFILDASETYSVECAFECPFETTSHPMLRSSSSGPEIGLLGRISAGF